MRNREHSRAATRALLTDTLPYEVPVIFSNDKLYRYLVSGKESVSEPARKLMNKILGLGSAVTKPYNYTIIKDGIRYTNLGIIHPCTQISISNFYETFSSALLESCSSDYFTLRRPIEPMPLFSYDELSGEETFKLGIPHLDPDDGQIDVSHFVSYFSYGKYNLLGKFVESEEFKRLEKRFKYLNTSDISRCFASIYTHSIAWAIKGKSFAKVNRSAFSFESKLDEIMQAANYGETNGIVVGPEFSRIFAEIILQSVDRSVINKLSKGHIDDKNLVNNKDYAIRRYVDDYFIFTNSVEVSESIKSLISSELEEYKLYHNKDKDKLFKRPFVSGISLARSDISELINELYASVDIIVVSDDPTIIAAKAKSIRSKSVLIRQACRKHDVELHVVSGWLLTNLRNMLGKLVRFAVAAPESISNSLYSCLSAILDLIFYVCAVDLRVRTTYALTQCMSILNEIRAAASIDLKDKITHFVSEEMAILIRNLLAIGPEGAVSAEMSNLLICGHHYIGPSFLRNDAARHAIEKMAYYAGMTYFRYITVKFCCRKSVEFSDHLKKVNETALSIISTRAIAHDAEAFLIFCDYISSPDTTLKEKRSVIKSAIGGNPSNEILEEVVDLIGFVDWDGTAIQHTLARKALRPVYTWS